MKIVISIQLAAQLLELDMNFKNDLTGSHSTDYQPSKSHTRHDSWKDRPDPWRPKSHDEDDTRER